MTDKSHDREHRPDTVAQYNTIRAQAENHLKMWPQDNLRVFCLGYNYSRRQVQRALSFNNTSWRKLKKAASG